MQQKLDGPTIRDAIYPVQELLRRRAAKSIRSGDCKEAKAGIYSLELLDRIDGRADEVAGALQPDLPFTSSTVTNRLLVEEIRERFDKMPPGPYAWGPGKHANGLPPYELQNVSTGEPVFTIRRLDHQQNLSPVHSFLEHSWEDIQFLLSLVEGKI